ncbi:hypothetical protein Q7A_03660 [Methylophaga nitratireducenticrescens]|nr:hypothetical protein Q7A_03660 [Methylophaga nitratireducenticrescens]AUZ84938.1 hypothetical protein CDW43_10275 [Methylophaga nitratireducenticrescens]
MYQVVIKLEFGLKKSVPTQERGNEKYCNGNVNINPLLDREKVFGKRSGTATFVNFLRFLMVVVLPRMLSSLLNNSQYEFG